MSSSTTAAASLRPCCWIALPHRVAVLGLELGREVEVEPLRLAGLAVKILLRLAELADLACASSRASRIVSSGISSAPASTIVRPSFVPTTIRSSDVSSFSCSVGLTMNSPSIGVRCGPRPPGRGTAAARASARRDAPLMHRMSCGVTMSALSTVQMTCTSFRKPFGQSGRIGRSIMRAVRVARSVARPSRLKKPPGILPAAYIRSSTSTVSGKKSAPSRASGAADCGGEHHRVAAADDDGAVGLLRELAGLEADLLLSNLDGDLSQALGRDTHSIVLHSALWRAGV